MLTWATRIGRSVSKAPDLEEFLRVILSQRLKHFLRKRLNVPDKYLFFRNTLEGGADFTSVSGVISCLFVLSRSIRSSTSAKRFINAWPVHHRRYGAPHERHP